MLEITEAPTEIQIMEIPITEAKITEIPIMEIQTMATESKSPKCTVWKFEDFLSFQILREIKFGESRSCKTAIFCRSRGCEFCNLGDFQPSKSAKIHKFKVQCLKCVIICDGFCTSRIPKSDFT